MRKFGRRFSFGRRRRKHYRQGCAECTLADVPVGRRACVRGFEAGVPTERRAHLQAYGLAPGYWVRILQHSPVTVVQIEHLELALENNLARQVQVELD